MAQKEDGLRERKRRETRQRILDAGMSLFFANGFEATTIEAIAERAGISRRTFFHYFSSKDDILLSMLGDVGDLVVAAVARQPDDKRPFAVARDVLVAICAGYPAEEMRTLDRLMRSSAAVQARKQANYVLQEQQLYAALAQKWPAPELQGGLRLVAMAAVGALRLSLEIFDVEDGRRPLPEILRQSFDALEAQV